MSAFRSRVDTRFLLDQRPDGSELVIVRGVHECKVRLRFRSKQQRDCARVSNLRGFDQRKFAVRVRMRLHATSQQLGNNGVRPSFGRDHQFSGGGCDFLAAIEQQFDDGE